jgi:UDP-N-acetylglucosamine 2-epimerase
VEPNGYLLVTLHREANVQDGPLERIAAALSELAEPVVFPAHPRTAAALAGLGIDLPAHVQIRPPAGYLDFAALASQARLVLTDSGGVQKEAYWYEVPCITLRTTTEWVETVDTGWNRLVGDDPELIVAAVSQAGPGPSHPPLYGDGLASNRVADLLCTMGAP